MRCIRCGREIPNNAQVCGYCRTPQPVNQQQQQRNPVDQRQAYNPQRQQQGYSGNQRQIPNSPQRQQGYSRNPQQAQNPQRQQGYPGNPQRMQNSQQHPQQQRYPANRPNQPQSPGKKPRPLFLVLIIVLSILLLFGITVGIIVFVSSSSSSKQKTKHEQTGHAGDGNSQNGDPGNSDDEDYTPETTQEASDPEAHSSETGSEKTEIETERSFANVDEEICATVASIVAPYVDEDYYFEADDTVLTEAALKVYDWGKELEQEGKITEAEYCEEGYSVSFTLLDGSVTAYIPQIKGYYQGNEDICITVIDMLPEDEKSNYDLLFYHNPAATITHKIPTATSLEFGNDTTIEDLKVFFGDLDEHPVRAIFWRGHGGVTTIQGKKVCAFITREIVTDEKEALYKEDRIKSTEAEDLDVKVLHSTAGDGDHHYSITYRFFKKYMADVNGGLFFSTTCHSHNDSGSATMAKTFLEKGFDSYVGTTKATGVEYGNAMISDTAKYLAEKDKNGIYTDIQTALEKAAQENSITASASDLIGRGGGRFELEGDKLFRLINPSFYVTFTSSDQSVEFDKISIKCFKIEQGGASHPYDRIYADELINGSLRIDDLKDGVQFRLDISYEGTLLKSVTYEYDSEGENREEVDLRKAWLDFLIIDKDQHAFDGAVASVWGVPGASGTNGLTQEAKQSKNANGQLIHRIPVEPGEYNYKITVPDNYLADPSEGKITVEKDTTLTIHVDADAKRIYAKYIREKLVPQFGMADLSDRMQVMNNTTHNEFIDWDRRTGLIGAEVVDLDGDGVFECLVYSLKEASEDKYSGGNALYVTVYTMDGKQNITQVTDELLNTCPDTCLVYNFLGTTRLDGKIMLYMEYYLNAYYANGDLFTYDFFTFENGKFYKKYRIYKSDGGSSEIAFSLLRCRADGSYDQEYLYGDNGFTRFHPDLTVYSTDEEEGIRHGFDLLGIPQSYEYLETAIQETRVNPPLVTYAHIPDVVTPSVRYLCNGSKISSGVHPDWEMHVRMDDYTGLSEWLEETED